MRAQESPSPGAKVKTVMVGDWITSVVFGWVGDGMVMVPPTMRMLVVVGDTSTWLDAWVTVKVMAGRDNRVGMVAATSGITSPGWRKMLA